MNRKQKTTRFAIINQKGGVGKTTIAINLSYELAKSGKTLGVDMDPQGNFSSHFCDAASPGTADLLANSAFDIKKAIHKSPHAIDIIPADRELAHAADRAQSKAHREKLLLRHLENVKGYQYIVIDCPPNLGVLSQNAIYAADVVLIPTVYSNFSLDGIADLLQTINEVKEQKAFNGFYIIRNAYEARSKKTNEYIEDQLKSLEDRVLKTRIRKSEPINQAQINRVPVAMFDGKSSGAIDYRSLATEVIEL